METTNFEPPTGVLGRNPKDPNAAPAQRAKVVPQASASLAYTTGAVGTAKVSIYRSQQDLDRGGMVIRLGIQDSEASFLPTAILTPEGTDIHIAGEAEAEAMVLALQTALLHLNADRAKKVGVRLPGDPAK